MNKIVRTLAIVLALMLGTVPAFAWDWEEAAMSHMPLVDEMLEISVIGSVSNPAWNTPYDQLNTYVWLKENANIDVTGERYVEDVYSEKVSLAIASGELPDVFLDCEWTPAEVTKLGADGVLIDLSELIKEHCPNLMKLFEEHPEVLRDSTMEDGSIYGLPYYAPCPRDMHTRLWMSQKWLDALELERPQTLDDLYNVLVAFRDKDPNGNDIADEIPVSGANGNSVDELILNAYGLKVRNGTQLLTDSADGEVFFVPTTEAYKAYLKYMNMLYDEKLLDAEAFIQSDEQMNAKGASDRIGMYASAASWLTCGFDVGMDHFQVGPFTSEMNDTKFVVSSGGYAVNRCYITVACENVEEVLKFIDFLYTTEGGAMMAYGPYGDWVWVDEEETKWNFSEEAMKYEGGGEAHRYAKATTNGAWGALLDPDWYLAVEATDPSTGIDLAKWLNDQTAEYQQPYFVQEYPQLPLTQEEADITTPIENDLSSYIANMRARFIIGEDDIDEQWDAYVAAIEGMGAQELVDTYQIAYDRFTKKVA